MFNHTVDSVTNWNAQLYREIKGKLNQRNITISVILSLIVQGFIYLIYQNSLPTIFNTVNRYCIGNIPPDQSDYYPHENNYCLQNAGGVFNINWQLWHLDIFICLSIIGIFFLLIPGCYLLIADLTKEEDRGTLNFIRLSPQTAQDFFVGKILGVPILIYLITLLGLPFHLLQGLQAQIPLSLIFAFYGVVIASCAFFYSGSLLYSLTFKELLGFKVWFGSGVLLLGIYLLCMVTMSANSLANNALDWSVMFYPGTMLIYLVKATNLSQESINYLSPKIFNELDWFGLNLWDNQWSGIAFTIANYLLGLYWLGSGLNRRFYNPDARVLTKTQSYYLTTLLTLVMVGFSLAGDRYYSDHYFGNFCILLGLGFLLCLSLIIILTPQRQSLLDWSRYGHQTSKKERHLWKQLIWYDDAPCLVTIAINWLIIAVISLLPIIFIASAEYRLALIGGLVLQLFLLILIATITQLLFMLKTPKRNVFALSAIALIIFSPLIMASFLSLDPDRNPFLWVFSMIPMVALVDWHMGQFLFSFLSQVVAIAFLNFYLTKEIRKLGESTTKALLAS